MPSPITIRPARDDDVPALLTLWELCGLARPHNHGPTDIAFARREPNSDVLVMEQGGAVIASAMVGHDGHRGWIYYLAVHPGHQRHGHGAEMAAQAEQWLLARGIWKVHLMVRSSNLAVRAFYERHGFTESEVIVLSKELRPMPYIDASAPGV